jgi:hypothetical protein
VTCVRCGGPTIALFSSFVCKAECDLRPPTPESATDGSVVVTWYGAKWRGLVVRKGGVIPEWATKLWGVPEGTDPTGWFTRTEAIKFPKPNVVSSRSLPRSNRGKQRNTGYR